MLNVLVYLVGKMIVVLVFQKIQNLKILDENVINDRKVNIQLLKIQHQKH
ncbi:unnamed protein product [Trichobilharzia regenti]|nr:unnamed protein product [Trichobilharzia regenti]